MSTPRYCECGNKIYVKMRRKQKSHWARGGRSPDHDLCGKCWTRLGRDAAKVGQ